MPYIRQNTNQRGHTYTVVHRDPTTRSARQETFRTRQLAQQRLADLYGAADATAELVQRKAAQLPFGHYADAWLAAQARRVTEGTMKQGTFDNYAKWLRNRVLPKFGQKPIGAITLADCEKYRAELAGSLSPRTVNNVWAGFSATLRYAQRAGAIPANPADHVERGRKITTRVRAHTVLTPSQIAAVADAIPNTPAVYESPSAASTYRLLWLFLNYSGLRRGEAQALHVGDLTPNCTKVRVHRTLYREGVQWREDTPKTASGHRTVPLPDWLAAELQTYLATVHGNPVADAPLWPARFNGGTRRKGLQQATRLNWGEHGNLQYVQNHVFRVAQAAAQVPAMRLHDTRHTAATLWLTHGVHFMQVAKWLGHASYLITMSVYADFMPEDEQLNPLPQPVARPQAAPRTAGNLSLLRASQ